MKMKIDWTISLFDVIFIVMFIALGYFAIQYDVASHNRAIRKCELIYNQTFGYVSNTDSPINFTLNNTTTIQIWRDIDIWRPY